LGSERVVFFNNFVAQHVYVITATPTFMGSSRSVPLKGFPGAT
jgi:hypothetical protein